MVALTVIAGFDANPLGRYNRNVFVPFYFLINGVKKSTLDRILKEKAFIVRELNVFRVVRDPFSNERQNCGSVDESPRSVVNALSVHQRCVVIIDPGIHQKWASVFLNPTQNGIGLQLEKQKQNCKRQFYTSVKRKTTNWL